jgi:hypothetical protein
MCLDMHFASAERLKGFYYWVFEGLSIIGQCQVNILAPEIGAKTNDVGFLKLIYQFYGFNCSVMNNPQWSTEQQSISLPS